MIPNIPPPLYSRLLRECLHEPDNVDFPPRPGYTRRIARLRATGLVLPTVPYYHLPAAHQALLKLVEPGCAVLIHAAARLADAGRGLDWFRRD